MAEVDYEEERRLAESLFPTMTPAQRQIAGAGALPTVDPNDRRMRQMQMPQIDTGFVPPSNLREGVTNFVQNAIVQPLKYGLYLDESPQRRGQRLSNQYKGLQIQEFQQELSRREQLVAALSPYFPGEQQRILATLPTEQLADLATERRGQFGQLSGAPKGTFGQTNVFTGEVDIAIEPTPLQQDIAAAGGAKQLAAQKAAGVTAEEEAKADVEIANIQPLAYQQRLAGRFTARMDAGDVARTKLKPLRLLQQLLRDGISTGAGQEQLMGIRNIMSTLGFDVQTIGEQEIFGALTKRLALAVRNPAGGEGMPGSMSNSDRDFLVATVPGLALTEQGNAYLLIVMERQLQRDIELAKLAEQHFRENRTHEGFQQKASDYAEANPMFDDIRADVEAIIAENEAAKRGVIVGDGDPQPPGAD